MNATAADPRDRHGSTDSPVIFFDGVCNLCHRSVRWFIRRDPRGTFRFASLQSAAAAGLLAGRTQGPLLDGVILLSGGTVWSKSDAWIQIFKRLGPGWSALSFLGIFPKKFRDGIYDVIAARRYRWFGKLDSCPAPRPELKDRFLD